jgi:toxin ParE1/3/4
LEIEEAAEWYDHQRPHLGDDFAEDVENAFDRICRDPLIHARLEHFSARNDIRRCLPHRFPYLVVYRYRPDEILVVAVMHVRRKPYYWLERLA